ncbi:MAG: adenylate/guanylate cyclase domain-containing protein [Roseibium sp.]|nr:adenylate/guanylate cyclase domain-containing protein [Roseibium sp.]
MSKDASNEQGEPAHSEDPHPRKYAPGVRLVRRERFELDLEKSINPVDVETWLLGVASKTTSAHALIAEFAGQLAQSGFGVDRFTVVVGTLHPQVRRYGWTWNTQDGICDEIQVGEETLTSGAYRNNPIYRVVEHGEVVRVSLSGESADARSPLMTELSEAGFSEYVALPLSARGEKYNAATFATREPGGFNEGQWSTLMRLFDIFALHVERHIASRIAENISLTYLGREAGQRVVNGTINRGAGLSIQAIVWSSDLRDFSTLSESAENETVANLLNRYFSVLAEAVILNGGDVLKFIGDGMLAIFPLANYRTPNLAAQAAASAAVHALRGLNTLNEAMVNDEDWCQLRTGIGLHIGEVFFGNIGSTRRLDFTVIGEAVNIASRVEGLCKPLEREVLMSESVAKLLGEETVPLGSHLLKGMQKPEQIFGLAD